MTDENSYTLFSRMEELEKQDQTLVNAAKASLPFSYAPYSSFHVACAIFLDNGEIVTGVNQENASSPAGLCAEQVALYRKGIAFPSAEIVCLAIVAKSKKSDSYVPVAPCGNCRQVMLEFLHRQESDFPILMQGENGSWIKVHSMESLLPFGFSSNSL